MSMASRGDGPDSQVPSSYRGSFARWRDHARERTWAWEPPVNRVTRVWSPLVALVVCLGAVFLATGELMRLLMFLVFYHSPFGMYAGIAAGEAMGLPMGAVVFTVFVLHLFVGLFVVWNADLLKRVPKLGSYVHRLEVRGRKRWEKRPRLRDLGVVGVGIFTALPVPGTGLITGALLGRLVGLPWFPTYVAVVLGGMARVVAITLVVYGAWEITPWS